MPYVTLVKPMVLNSVGGVLRRYSEGQHWVDEASAYVLGHTATGKPDDSAGERGTVQPFPSMTGPTLA